MSSATVTKFKWFWPDQDVEQEQWLRAMAQQGLHLRSLNLLQRWTFVKGEPADMVYRVDFNSHADKPDYRKLLEDAGWERAASLTGWQYWRTKAVNGRAPELFTDTASKSVKFWRLLGLIFVCCLPAAILFSSPASRDGLSTLSWPFVALLITAYGLNLVGVVRLFARLVKMRSVQS